MALKGKSTGGDWSVAHRLPGRVRLESSQLAFNPELAAGLEKKLRSASGVTEVQASACSGTVLIHFDERKVSLEKLVASARTAAPVPVQSLDGPTRRSEKALQHSSDRPEKASHAGAAVEIAIALRHAAQGADRTIRGVSGGRLELRQIVLAFLLFRPAISAAQVGLLSWATIQAAVEFVVAWTLYENPAAEEQAQKAKSVATPLP